MALELPTLLQRYQLDSSGAVTGARTGTTALSTLGGAFRSLRGLVESAGLAFSAVKIVDFFKESVHGAAQSQEELRTVRSLFGSSAEEIKSWAENNAAGFGIAGASALQYSTKLGTILKGFGFFPNAAASMTLSLEKVAGDVAAFRNQDPSQVIAAFTAGLYGSSRGLRQYGIDVSAAKIHQTALSLGITTATKDWDAQTKAQVFYALIMRGTTTEVGAAAKRQHDLAFETKVLHAEMENLRDKIGTALLPIISAFVGMVTRDVVPALSTFANWIITIGKWVGDKLATPIKTAIRDVREVIGGFLLGLHAPGANVDPLGPVARRVVQAGQTMRRVGQEVKKDFDALFAGLKGHATDGSGFQKVFNDIGITVHRVVDDIQKAWGRLKPILDPIFNLIQNFLGSTGGKAATAGAGITVLGIALGALAGPQLLSSIAGLSNILGFVWQAVKDISFATAGWIAVIALAVGAVIYLWKTNETFRNGVKRLVDIFEKEWLPKIKDAAVVLRDDLASALHAVQGWLSDIWPTVKRVAVIIGDDLVGAVRGLVSWFAHLNPYVQALIINFGLGLINPILGVAGAFGFLIARSQGFRDIIKGLFERIGPPILAFARIVGHDLVEGFRSAVHWVQSIAPELQKLAPVLIAIGIAMVDPATAAVYAYTRFKAFRDVVNEVGQTVKREAPRFGHDLSVGFAVARSIIEGLVNFTRSYLIPTFIEIGKIVEQVVVGVVIPLLQNLWATFSNITQQLVTFVKEHWEEIRTIIKAVMIVVGAIIEVVLKAALLLWHTFGKEAMAVVRIVFTGIRETVESVMRIVLGVIGLVLDLLTGHWSKAWHDLLNILSGVWELIISNLKNGGKLLGEVLRIAVAGLGALWRGAWTVLVDIVRLAIKGMLLLLKDIGTGILDVFKNAGTWLLDAGKLILRGLLLGVKLEWKLFEIWFVEIPKVLLKILKNAPKWLVPAGKAILTGLWDGAKLIWKGVLLWFNFQKDLLRILKNAPQWLVDVGGKIIHGLWDGAKDAWHAFQNWFRTFDATVVRIFKGAPGWLASAGRSIVTGLWNGAKFIWNRVIPWFGNFEVSVLKAIGNVLVWLVGKGKDMIQGLWNGAISVWDSFIGWVRGLPDAIKGLVGDALSWLKHVGEDMIQGLWNGMIAIWHKVTGWIGDIVKHVPKIFRSLLGSSSPSKVMHAVGVDTMEGFRLGLVDHYAKVKDTMSMIGADITQSMTGAMSKAALTPGAVPTGASLSATAAGFHSMATSVGLAPSIAAAAAAGGDQYSFGDVNVFPEEHVLTEAGLMTKLRFAERHGTLRTTGVPRTTRGRR